MIDQRILQQELQHLKRFRQLKAYLLLLPALGLLIPVIAGLSYTPFPYNNNGVPDAALIGYTLAAHLFFIYVSVRTGFIAAQSINREFDGGTWEILQMSNIPIARILWSKWLAVLRTVALDHLIAAVPRFAYLVMFSIVSYRVVYLNMETDFCRQFSGFMMPYCQRQSAFLVFPMSLPALHQLALSAVMLSLYALAGAGFIAALGITAALIARRSGAQMVWLWGVRLALSLVIMFLMVFVSRYNYDTFNLNSVTDNASFCDNNFEYPPREECPRYYALRNQQRVVETLQVGITSLVDNGTLLNLNLLNNSLNLTNGTFVPSLASLGRTTISAGVAAALYAGLIWLAMWVGIRRYEGQVKE